ncbi:MAG: hypothetical protein R3178_01295, partial [Rhodothermales bacterium]|nr:hypothetical protein [Rhodothermales bacterium]
GPDGLISVAGNKFTSSRLTAERVMQYLNVGAHGKWDTFDSTGIAGRTSATTFDFDWLPAQLDSDVREVLSATIRDESVVHLDDLVLRRTGIGDNPRRALALTDQLMDLFDWNADRREAERDRLTSHFRRSAG